VPPPVGRAIATRPPRAVGAVLVALALVLVWIVPSTAAPPFGWRVERVDAGTGAPWLALDAAGDPHVAYLAAGEIRYARRVGGLWQTRTVATGDLGPPVLALDAAGRPHLAFSDRGGALRYAGPEASGWSVETYERASGGSRGLAVGPDGTVHVLFYHSGPPYMDGALRYARRDPAGGWTLELVVQALDTGAHHGLALDAAGVLHASIGAGVHAAGEMRYGRRDPGGWSIETVSTFGAAEDDAVALDPGGDPRIAYFDAAGSNLMYARRVGAGWRVETVDETGLTGQGPSLAVGPGGEPRIAYHGDQYGREGLKHARLDGGRWAFEIVDPAGGHPSLALDAAGRAGLAYLAAGEIRYATEVVLIRRGVLPLAPRLAGA
jgi:hypothetical protein